MNKFSLRDADIVTLTESELRLVLLRKLGRALVRIIDKTIAQQKHLDKLTNSV